MKSPSIVFPLCIFFTLCILAHSNDVFAKKPFVAKVTKIIDGDSLKVRDGKKVYEIRLYGIDAPEYDQPYSSAAKNLVKYLILQKEVNVVPVEWDKYHRLVAIVSYKNEAINERLLSYGLAWYYPKYCKKRVCRDWEKIEKTAKENNKNIWSDSSSVAPWTWKYNKHKRK